MKKVAALFCASLLALGIPAVAFGEETEEPSETSVRVEPRIDPGNLGGNEVVDATGVTYSLLKGEVSWGDVVEGTITNLEIKFADTAVSGLSATGPNTTEAPKPYAVDGSKTVLNTMAFSYNFFLNGGPDPTLSVPAIGATIKYTYQANEGLVKKLAKENGIAPEDIDLFIYVRNTAGQVTQLASGSSASALSVPQRSLESSTFVMALACDTSLLNKPVDKPVDSDFDSDDNWDSDDSSDSDAPAIQLVKTGPDTSATSPTTGQAVPTETAPLALAVVGALGVATLLISRRRTR